jgi:anti-sigma factor RsiW
MSACESIREDLVAYLDGELRTDQAAGIRAHLEACAACRKESSALEASWRALGSLSAAQPEAGSSRALALEILATVSRQDVPISRPWSSRRAVAVVALAAAVLVALGIAWPWMAPAPHEPGDLGGIATGPAARPGFGAAAVPQVAVSHQAEILAQQELLENLDVLQDLDLLVFYELLLVTDEEDLESS